MSSTLDSEHDLPALAAADADHPAASTGGAANEERIRIARELHDGLGQSLAYLGFEMDRLLNQYEVGVRITGDLQQLREDLRDATRELRDTLCDLRTDVSAERGLVDVIEQLVHRVRSRSSLEIQVDAERGARLGIAQERELWRIAQEALTNVERHSKASAVRVVWRCDGKRAELCVIDNGIGFDQHADHADRFGLLGMRERASSIGATLELVTSPGRGTTVRCTVAPPEARTTRPRASAPGAGGAR